MKGDGGCAKKELSVETTSIDPLSLVFASQALEQQWRRRNLPRQKDISIRYFAAAALFQLLFLWADAIDRQPFGWPTVARICLAVLSAMVALAVGLSMLTPRPHILFWIQLAYGFPTLILYSMHKPILSHWDSLFLVYGLCFMTLPQVTPLNFFFGSMGSGLFMLLYVCASALRLEVDQWVLSSIFLLIVSALFCYIAYRAEKGARERWLLRQRLSKEHISIELRPLRVEDSIERGAMVFDVSALLTTLGQYTSNATDAQQQRFADSANASRNWSSNSTTSRFLKGMFAWLLCTTVGYLAEYIQVPQFQDAQMSGSFALFVHTVGFSMFLVVTTGQIRWLAVNGIMGLAVLWVLTQVVPSPSMTFWAHMFGYLLLACVVVTVIVVFGGVVLVWSHLLDYLRDILQRYPQVQGDVKASKLLEQVLIRHVASLKSSKVLTRTFSDPRLTLLELNASESDCAACTRPESLDTQQDSPTNVQEFTDALLQRRASSQQHKLLPVLHGRKPKACYFCLRADANFLIPACDGWHSSIKSGETVSMCTPYATVMQTRDALQTEVKQQAEHIHASQLTLFREQQDHALTQKQVAELQRRLLTKDQQAIDMTQKQQQLLRQERARRDEDVGKLLQTLNKSVGKIKQLQKVLSKREPARHNDAFVTFAPAVQHDDANLAIVAPAALNLAEDQIAEGKQEEQQQPVLVTLPIVTPNVELADWDPSRIDDDFWLQPLDTIEELFAHTFRPLQPQPQQAHSARRMRYTHTMGLGDTGTDGNG